MSSRWDRREFRLRPAPDHAQARRLELVLRADRERRLRKLERPVEASR